jgi:predicted RNA-binding Zn ribbon-like protein
MSKQSRKFRVPDALANVYDFANTLDLRHFVHHGVQHQQADELGNPAALGAWMQERGLSERGTAPAQKTFGTAIVLRGAIRDYLKCDPDQRRKPAVVESLSKAMAPFPLRVAAARGGGMKLSPMEANAPPGLSAVVAELYDGSANGMLDRLKMCAADECQRLFYDRSKPGTRRWCQSALCGNRMKTRAYRERQKREAGTDG